MEKSLKSLLDSLPFDYTNSFGDLSAIRITSLEVDSRKVTRGTLFFALQGVHVNGADYIKSALDNGAAAVIYSSDTPKDLATNKTAPLIKVSNAREALWKVSCAFFDNPSDNLITIGVTGTEGKSSTVAFIWQLLRLMGLKAGFISTVEYSLGGEALPNPEHQTTPESFVVQEKLAAMKSNGCTYAVVEASSHGLSKKLLRLGGVKFDVAVFMNVTEEHLEFHKTFDQYRFDKANLFRALDEYFPAGSTHKKIIAGIPTTIESFGVVNKDDPSADYFSHATKDPVYSFSLSPSTSLLNKDPSEKNFFISSIDENNENAGLTFLLNDTLIKTPLKGAFNAMNVAAALIVTKNLLKCDLERLAQKTERLTPIKGRMTEILCGQPFRVIVDYAHTPSSFMAIMPGVRKSTPGRVLALFGSGGERDRVKRPIQGEISARFCDIIILSDEDPRGEDPRALLMEIAAGAIKKGKTLDEDLLIIPDRTTAIKKAFSLAKAGDTVLLLGKAHENSIIYKDHTLPYDEISTAKNILLAQ